MAGTDRVLLIGLGVTALGALESLATRVSLVGVVREAGEAGMQPDPVALRARQLRIPIYEDASPAAIGALVSRIAPDCVVVSSYNRILSAELLARSRFVNVHYSALPRYRGRANVNWAVINDEPATAITIHVMSPGLDAGNILFQRAIQIGPRDTVGALYRQLNELQQEHLGRAVVDHLRGATGFEQNEAEASYGCTRLPEDGQLDWSAPTRRLDCMVRGLSDPFPGAWTYLNSQQLTVWSAEPVENAPAYVGRVPGRVVGRSTAAGSVDVLTGDGVLRLHQVQLEGEDRVPAANVIRSVRTTLGLRTHELLARIACLERQLNELARFRPTTKNDR